MLCSLIPILLVSGKEFPFPSSGVLMVFMIAMKHSPLFEIARSTSLLFHVKLYLVPCVDFFVWACRIGS